MEGKEQLATFPHCANQEGKENKNPSFSNVKTFIKYEVISFLFSGFYAYLEIDPISLTKANMIVCVRQCSRQHLYT